MKALVILAALVLCVATAEAKKKVYDCKDGQQNLFYEFQNDELQKVLRTCVNGSYYAPVAPVRVLRCRTGESIVVDSYQGGEYPVQEIRTCVNGRFYPYQPQPTSVSCVEGAEELQNVSLSQETPRVWKVCRDGKWKNLFN